MPLLQAMGHANEAKPSEGGVSVWRILAWLSFLVGYGMVCLPAVVALALSLLLGEMTCNQGCCIGRWSSPGESRVTAFLMWYGMQNSLMNGFYHVRCPSNG